MAAVPEDEVRRLAKNVGYDIPETQIGDFMQLLARTKTALETVTALDGSYCSLLS